MGVKSTSSNSTFKPAVRKTTSTNNSNFTLSAHKSGAPRRRTSARYNPLDIPEGAKEEANTPQKQPNSGDVEIIEIAQKEKFTGERESCDGCVLILF